MILFWEKVFLCNCLIQWKQACPAYNIFQILVHTKSHLNGTWMGQSGLKTEKYWLYDERITTSIAKIDAFSNIFFSLRGGPLHLKKVQKTMILAKQCSFLLKIALFIRFLLTVERQSYIQWKILRSQILIFCFQQTDDAVTHWPPCLWKF